MHTLISGTTDSHWKYFFVLDSPLVHEEGYRLYNISLWPIGVEYQWKCCFWERPNPRGTASKYIYIFSLYLWKYVWYLTLVCPHLWCTVRFHMRQQVVHTDTCAFAYTALYICWNYNICIINMYNRILYYFTNEIEHKKNIPTRRLQIRI